MSFSIVSSGDALSRLLEPGAPPTSARFRAMETLSRAGILTGVTMMPLLPFIHEDIENVREIITRARDASASYIIPTFGMTQRAGQQYPSFTVKVIISHRCSDSSPRTIDHYLNQLHEISSQI